MHPVGDRVGLLVSRRSGAEQLAALVQMLLFGAVGQEAVMPDAEEMVRQDVLQKAAEELLDGKYVDLQPVAVATIPIAVMHHSVVASDKAMVADGHAMGVAAKVVQ